MPTTATPRPPLTTTALFALMGPAALGAGMSLGMDGATMLSNAAWTPAIILLVAALMMPALYIATTFARVAPPAREVGRATLGLLRAVGLCCLGMTPALAFLVATSTSATAPFILGQLVLFMAAALGIVAFWRFLFGEDRLSAFGNVKALPLFGVWGLITVAIGWRMFTHLIVMR